MSDEPAWRRIGRLAEYAARTFLPDMPFGTAVMKYLADIGNTVSRAHAMNWIEASQVWSKTAPQVRRELTAQVYYLEAAKSKEYRAGKINATKAVIRQKERRRQRTFKNAADGIVVLSNLVDSGVARLQWLEPHRARYILDHLPLIEKFLRRAANRKEAA